MNNLIKIGNHEITIKEFKGRRVVTFKDIEIVHERPDGTAGRNFRDNKERFINGTDYFFVKPQDIQTDEIRRSEINNSGTYLITEQGYLMLVKSFTDDLAWTVQRQLVNTSFKQSIINGLSTEMQALLMHDKKIQAVVQHISDTDKRVDKLENNMVIDYGQQLVLEKLVNNVVVTALGGKESNAYKEVSKKVFSECNRDLKDHFNVNSRNNIPKLKFEEACTYIKKWQPCTNTKILIEDFNAQMCI